MSMRNFLVRSAACFIPNREKRKAFRRRYRQPETEELLRRRVAVLEEAAKKLDNAVQILERERNERQVTHSIPGGVCMPQIKGEGNRIVIWEKGVSRELRSGERIAGFTEIVIDGNDNTLELEMPLGGFENRLYIHGNGNLCQKKSSFKFMTNIICFVGSRGTLKIGKNTTMRSCCVALGDMSHVEIGKECMFGECDIRGTDSHCVIDVVTKQAINAPKSGLWIGNRVWCGEKSRILKNAFIADGCIVGACTVVSKKFTEPNCAIAGNPAMVIRTGVTWDRYDILLYEERGPFNYDEQER